MARSNEAPDLTMLAMAAYDAIRKSMEDTHEKKTHMEGEPDQRGDRLRDRSAPWRAQRTGTVRRNTSARLPPHCNLKRPR